MTAVANPLMVGMMNPTNIDSKKHNPIFTSNELAFVPTLSTMTQNQIISNRPTTLFGYTPSNNYTSATEKMLPETPMYNTVLNSQPIPQQYQGQFVQQQLLQEQMKNQQVQQEQMQQQQLQQQQMQQQLLQQQQQQQQQQQVLAQGTMQMPATSQGNTSLAIKKKDVLGNFNQSIVISLETYTSSNVAHIEARGLQAQEVSEVAKVVARVKKESDKRKIIQIALFGLLGYYLWRNESMGRRLFRRLDPLLEETNEQLVRRNINVRFAWTEGELRAYF